MDINTEKKIRMTDGISEIYSKKDTRWKCHKCYALMVFVPDRGWQCSDNCNKD